MFPETKERLESRWERPPTTSLEASHSRTVSLSQRGYVVKFPCHMPLRDSAHGRRGRPVCGHAAWVALGWGAHRAQGSLSLAGWPFESLGPFPWAQNPCSGAGKAVPTCHCHMWCWASSPAEGRDPPWPPGVQDPSGQGPADMAAWRGRHCGAGRGLRDPQSGQGAGSREAWATGWAPGTALLPRPRGQQGQGAQRPKECQCCCWPCRPLRPGGTSGCCGLGPDPRPAAHILGATCRCPQDHLTEVKVGVPRPPPPVVLCEEPRGFGVSPAAEQP